MSRHRAVLFSLALVLLVAHARAGPIKLMLLGDSITQGANGYIGYRYPLYFELNDAKFEVDYVGTETTGQPGVATNAALFPEERTTFDRDHEGHYGYTTAQILDDKKGFRLNDSAQKNKPDIVVIHLGTNDLNRAGATDANGYQPTINNLGVVIDDLRKANPGVKILLSKIIPLAPDAPFGFGRVVNQVAGYNAALAKLADGKTIKTSPISMVDQFTNYDPAALNQTDGIHPNQYGGQPMADRYFVALQKCRAPDAAVKSPPVKIANANFDDFVQTNAAVAVAPPAQGWTFTRSASADGGVFKPTDATYTMKDDSASGSTGVEAAYLFNVTENPGENRSAISQTLGAIVTPHTNYSVTVAVGNRLATNRYGTTFGGYMIELRAGDTVIASQADRATPPDGTFADVSTSVSSDVVDKSMIGKELNIRLTITSDAAHAATDFDNVRLTAEANR